MRYVHLGGTGERWWEVLAAVRGVADELDTTPEQWQRISTAGDLGLGSPAYLYS